MFDIGSSELLLIVVVAVVVIGPRDLPRALYKLGQIIGKGRAMTRHFRAGLDEMVRQAELEEMEKKWAADNARIMAEAARDGEKGSDGLPAVQGFASPPGGILPDQGAGEDEADHPSAAAGQTHPAEPAARAPDTPSPDDDPAGPRERTAP